ncbi:hypothetical protein [Sphingomonas sp. CFBP 13720]|uniref:hypothetical protein n=1 Tax=Sphingomonas sp. CFBP 13720 TaxID=2775302 RepID=UPI00177D89E8|nr:hypothetical protein [Sphingomonas sp. CFBP 13720]MBD8678310.1 hypothetical protein [Sphingomonas sp. CFBP 13720]
MITLFNVGRDEVIRSSVSLGLTNYRYALENLLPLIDKFDEQRKVQRRKFYDRLRLDIVRGCIMPPLTLAFIDSEHAASLDIEDIQRFVERNIQDGYVLDGMQRLNTLKNASLEENFNGQLPLYVNVIIAERYDLLLYRMITLNNGQKPMTARHQIEMLTKGMLDTEHLGISIVSEKETETSKPQGAFKRGDIAAAYTAFLTNSVHNDNSRIIESKLDEILVAKVMDSNLTELTVSFQDALKLVDKFSADVTSRDWLRLGNNLIGFSVGLKNSKDTLNTLTPEKFKEAVETFEDAFSALNVSKINVGKFRRELSRLFISKIEQYLDSDVDKLTEIFFRATLVE